MKKIESTETDKEKIARKNVLRKSDEAEGLSIKGYDFNEGVNYDKILESYKSTGIQASNMHKAIEIINEMISSGAFIYLGYTSNIITSGLREIIRYLAENKKVGVMVTTAGGIEEDIIKCLGDFKLGNFRLSGKVLREKGINRAGNILIPNSRYCEFEDFVIPILEESKLYEDQPEYALLFSWQITDELVQKLKERGFRGDFIVPLPTPRIIKNK